MLSTHRKLARIAGLVFAAAFVFAACSGTGAGASLRTSAGDMAALEAAAKAEGNLTTIALPHSWCNYGEALTGFTKKYGIKINELNPDGSSAQEVDAIKANKTNPGPQAPDVIDVGLSFGPQAKTDALIAPYKVATWTDIPAAAKDADGYWYGDYYGVLSFETNTKVVKNVPADWADLLKPEYKGQVALSGDPTQSNQAISAVWAAALANGGSLDNVQPGLDFFKQLNDKATSSRSSPRPPRSHPARPRSGSPGPTTVSATRTASRAIRPSRSPCPRRAASAACTSRRSAPSPRIPMPLASGWSTSTPTRASSSG